MKILSYNKKINFKIRYGACGMQGWRKRMEDSHISDMNLGPNKSTHLFGVFDGHGGKKTLIKII